MKLLQDILTHLHAKTKGHSEYIQTFPVNVSVLVQNRIKPNNVAAEGHICRCCCLMEIKRKKYMLEQTRKSDGSKAALCKKLCKNMN